MTERTTRAQRMTAPLATGAVKCSPRPAAGASAPSSSAAPTSTPRSNRSGPLRRDPGQQMPRLRRTSPEAAGGAVPGRLAPRGRTHPPARPARRLADLAPGEPKPSSSTSTRPARTPATSASSSPNSTPNSPEPESAATPTPARKAAPAVTAPPGGARTPRTCPAARSALAPPGMSTGPGESRDGDWLGLGGCPGVAVAAALPGGALAGLAGARSRLSGRNSVRQVVTSPCCSGCHDVASSPVASQDRMMQPQPRQNRINEDETSQRCVLRGDPFDRVGKPLSTS
jgi:hypothetical protein